MSSLPFAVWRIAQSLQADTMSVFIDAPSLHRLDEARREQGYASIEEVVVHKRGAFKGAVASNFAAACVPTLCREVLCADDSKVNAKVCLPSERHYC